MPPKRKGGVGPERANNLNKGPRKEGQVGLSSTVDGDDDQPLSASSLETNTTDSSQVTNAETAVESDSVAFATLPAPAGASAAAATPAAATKEQSAEAIAAAADAAAQREGERQFYQTQIDEVEKERLKLADESHPEVRTISAVTVRTQCVTVYFVYVYDRSGVVGLCLLGGILNGFCYEFRFQDSKVGKVPGPQRIAQLDV